MVTNSDTKIRTKRECDICDYVTCDSKDFAKHIKTIKHKTRINSYKNPQKSEEHICMCGKQYKHRQNLYAHKKKCEFIKNTIDENANNQLTPMQSQDVCLMQIIQDNNDFKKILMELIPKVGNNNTQNNTQNNKFNINVFLNEKCKDAMSMNEFVESIEISLQDLMKTKDEGFASGISNIFIKGMSKLSPYQRPLHCTDVKRETLYIKNDKWEKDADKERIKTAIKSVSAKQFKNINKYKDANPNYMDHDAEREEYFNLLKSTTEPVEDNDNKIIKSICPSIYVKANAEYGVIEQ